MYELLTWQLPWAGVNHWRIALATAGERPALPPPEALPGPDKPDGASLAAYCQLMRWGGQLCGCIYMLHVWVGLTPDDSCQFCSYAAMVVPAKHKMSAT
jgi:hypothetical protein